MSLGHEIMTGGGCGLLSNGALYSITGESLWRPARPPEAVWDHMCRVFRYGVYRIQRLEYISRVYILYSPYIRYSKSIFSPVGVCSKWMYHM